MKRKKQNQAASGLTLGTTLLGALISGVAAAQNADAPAAPPAQAPVAEAQQAAAQAADETTEVTITGSRIRMVSGLTTPTPVTVISNVELNNMSPISLVDALDAVPSFFNNVNASTSFSSNVPAAQGTNVNLRGLGPNRTLTLLDGRRVVPGSKIGTVNIANFPSAAIERVDVVTGGASAVYGTDAVAGVTNFILNTGFTGFKANVQGGISSRADNENGKMELTFGTPIGDNMHLILSGEISQEEGIKDPESRGWYQRWGTILNKEFADTGVGPKRIRAKEVVSVNWTCGGLILQPGSALNRLQFNPDGTSSPFVFANNYVPGDTVQSLAAGTGGASGGCRDYQFSDAGPQLTNTVGMKNAFGYLDYKIGDNAKVYFQVIHGDSAVTTSGGSGVLEAPWQLTIFRDNAFLPADIAATMDAEHRTSFTMHRNFAEVLTNQALDIDNVNLSLTTGFDWNLHTDGFLDGWQVQGYYQYGRNKQHNGIIGYIRTQTLNVAIDSVRDPATGKIVCHAALTNALFKDCIPYNVFGEGNASGEAMRYITTPADGEIDHFFINREDVAELSMNGQIAKGWAGPISGAFGVDYRKESIESYQTGLSAQFDTPTNTTPGVRGVPSGYAADPDVQLFGSFADVDGRFDVKEAFVEGLVPLLSGLPLVKQLNFTPAARWADYEPSGNIWAYKGGLDWDLNSQFRVRSTYSRDVRAATLAERFDQQRASGAVTDDPVAGGSYRFSQTNGGNPNVAPEKADTLTAGIVFQPSWLEGFNMTLDWWDIKIAGAIGRLATQDIIVRCFQGASSLCPLITRDPTSRQITDVQNVYININEERARGIDLELHYTKSLDGTPFEFFKNTPQRVTFGFLGTKLLTRSTLIPGAPTLDVVGEIPPGGDIRESAYPKYVFNANVAYTVGNFTARLQTRFYDGGVVDNTLVEGVDIDDNSVDSSYWTDLRLGYQRDSWEVFAQAINLFDQAPPIGPALAAQGNTHFYDVKGQRFVVGAKWQFK